MLMRFTKIPGEDLIMKKYIAIAALSLSIAALSLFLGNNIDIDLSENTELSVQI